MFKIIFYYISLPYYNQSRKVELYSGGVCNDIHFNPRFKPDTSMPKRTTPHIVYKHNMRRSNQIFSSIDAGSLNVGPFMFSIIRIVKILSILMLSHYCTQKSFNRKCALQNQVHKFQWHSNSGAIFFVI